mmetsp:Transcript_21850/g.61886  ORF Transcript_21850/g.61886 Transcript_21850/m.61886 type:complete len:373 (+) Transcript_21850:678-1796(+)
MHAGGHQQHEEHDVPDNEDHGLKCAQIELHAAHLVVGVRHGHEDGRDRGNDDDGQRDHVRAGAAALSPSGAEVVLDVDHEDVAGVLQKLVDEQVSGGVRPGASHDFVPHDAQRPELVEQDDDAVDADRPRGEGPAPPTARHEDDEDAGAEGARLRRANHDVPHILVVHRPSHCTQEKRGHELHGASEDQAEYGCGGEDFSAAVEDLRVDQWRAACGNGAVEEGEVLEDLRLRVLRVHEHLAEAVADVRAHHHLHQDQHRWPDADPRRPQRGAVQEQKHHGERRRPKRDNPSERLRQSVLAGFLPDQGPRELPGVHGAQHRRHHDRVQEDALGGLSQQGAPPVLGVGLAHKPGAAGLAIEDAAELKQDHGQRL